MVAMILEREGFWVKPNLKVHLTKAEKRAIGRPTSPRWEIDLVAYKGAGNELLAVECKSYLDSKGVSTSGFLGHNERKLSRYKLFNEPVLRKVVFKRLILQLQEAGLVSKNPTIQLCLAAGKFASQVDRETLQQHFIRNGWRLFDDVWLRKRLLQISDSGYEDEVTAIVAKLLLRES